MHTPAPKLSVASQNDKEIEGGIAHDCSDLLMVILGHAELLAMRNFSQETRVNYIERIESATKQIRDQIDRAAHSQVACD
jgi:hypothetical protein